MCARALIDWFGSSSTTHFNPTNVDDQNLEKIPVPVVVALEAKLSSIPAWGVRITKEKLEVLGGES